MVISFVLLWKDFSIGVRIYVRLSRLHTLTGRLCHVIFLSNSTSLYGLHTLLLSEIKKR